MYTKIILNDNMVSFDCGDLMLITHTEIVGMNAVEIDQNNHDRRCCSVNYSVYNCKM